MPVVEIGDAVGIKEGGVVEHHLRELQVECLPQDVPDQIEVDITERRARRHDPRAATSSSPPGVTILTNPEDAVLSIITPAVLRVEADLSVPGEEGVGGRRGRRGRGRGRSPRARRRPAEGEGAEAPAAEEGGES